VPIYRDMAFEPRYRLTPRIIRQIKAIERTAGMIEAVRMKPEWIKEVRAQATVREALASVQIEGSTLTLEQAFALADEIPERDLRDSEREFCNYLHAFDAIDGYRAARDIALQKGDLLNLHRILMDGVRGGKRFAGQFRREDVEVGDRVGGSKTVHHKPPNWSEVETEVDQLLDWIEATKIRGDGEDDPWVHAGIQAGIAHHRLAWIHPFVDGNGRTARMFTSMLLYQREYDFKYLFELSDYYNERRDEYYAALRSADRTDDYTEWLTFFLGGFAYQMVRTQELVRNGED
jgi:Fic family protein